MTGVEQPRRLPRIVVTVRRGSGRYRRHLDLGAPDAAASDLPAVRDDAVVRLDVADGIRAEDLAMVSAFASRIRNAERLEIIGTSRRAVEAARSVFLNAWRLDVDPSTPAEPERASVARWAALMLGTVRDGGGQR